MDLSDPVLERRALDVVFHVAIFEGSFKGNELAFLECLGELREISPGIDSRCHSVRVSHSPLSFFQLSWVAMLRTTNSRLF